jgi:hypothetical protein
MHSLFSLQAKIFNQLFVNHSDWPSTVGKTTPRSHIYTC